MKVNTQLMDEAYVQLSNLQRQLQEVESNVQCVQRTLRLYKIGGAGETESIVASLRLQVKEIEQRVRGTDQLAQVLRSASDQYQRCEAEADGQSQNTLQFAVHFKPCYLLENLAFIQPKREQEVINQYIMPFIVK